MKTKLLHPIARLLLAILMCLPICGSPASAQEAESYAVFDETTNTLTFKHDTKKPYGAFALNEGDNAPGWYKSNGYVSNANTIEKVVFDASFANARPTSCCKWFFGCTDLTTIEGIEYLNTENVTEMSGMFCGCKALTMLDVSKFDTKNVQSMSCMFWGCHALTTLDISNFDTQNVTEMSGMFDGCSALTTIYASDKFVTTACKYDYNMFKGCTNLVGAVPYDEYKIGKEMANYTTGYFTDIASKIAESYVVFDEATNTLTFKRDTNKPAGAFELNEDYNAPGWYKPNGDRNNTNIIKKVIFDTSFANARPTSCYNWFCGCTELTTIEGIEYLNTENVTNMDGMFQNCKSLTTLDLSRFDTKNVTNISGMFYACHALTTLDVSNFDTKNVTDMSHMFFECSALTTLDISNFNTENVTNMSGMFWGCAALTTLDLSHFDTQNVTDMNGMFCNCSALTTLDVSNFDTKNVTNMSGMFSGCSALNTLDIANFDTQNVTDMSGMFNGCRALTTLDVSNFDTQNVTNMGYMFCSCYKLTTLDVSNFDTKNVTNMSWMFCFDPALTTIYASDKFVTTACEEDDNMFAECANLMGAVPYDENKLGKEMANYTTGYFTDIASKVVEPYAVFDEATNTLTFKHDTKKPYGAFALNEGGNAPGWNDESNANIIKKVIFDASFANARPTSCYRWFDGCDKLTTIEGIEYLNTENVTNMSLMFSNCWILTTLDVSKFDTKNVTDMIGMFSSCEALTTLDVSNFDTQNVTDMSDMFNGCKALTTLDIANFDTKNVTDMSGMFWGCAALTTLDVSHFDTQNVTKMDGMFCNCYALTTLDVSNFDTKNVTNMSGMFSSCYALTTLDIASFDTQNVTDMNGMFNGCRALTTLDVSNFDTQNVTNMGYMFGSCYKLTTLDVSNFDTKNVTDMSWMFSFDPALTTIYASDKFVTTACEVDENMFAECANLMGAVPYDENKVGKEMANYTTGYFTYKTATGIDAPTVSDDTAAEYYDLQGRRLNAPQKGVNIVKRGKKTTKVLVK